MTKTATIQTFRSFLLRLIEDSKKTPRQFAIDISVDPTTVTRAISATNPTKPGLEFLIKLSRGTNTKLSTLIALAYPEAQEGELNPEVEFLAQRIQGLPDEQRRALISLVFGKNG